MWYIADHIRDPIKPIIPLAALRPAGRQLNADFIGTISAALDHDDKRPADRVRHGHRNLSLCSLTSLVAANWAGAYKYAKDTTEQVNDEVKNKWVEQPLLVPSTWPFRLEQQNGISQGVKENGEPKVRRATDKGHGPNSVNGCIELVSKLKLCTNLQGRFLLRHDFAKSQKVPKDPLFFQFFFCVVFPTPKSSLVSQRLAYSVDLNERRSRIGKKV